MAEENESTQPEQAEEQENNTPATQSPNADVTELQSQLSAMQAQNAQYQQVAFNAQIAQQATLEAVALGIDVKTIPYVLKMADMSGVKANEDGTLDIESIQAAIGKVLDDIPMLKPQQDTRFNGFRQIGAGGAGSNSRQSDELARIFGNTK